MGRLAVLAALAGLSITSSACFGTYEYDVEQTEQGVVTMSVIPRVASVNAGGSVTFDADIGVSVADATNVVVTVSMDDLNDLLDADDTGLAEDAEVDYGSGVFEFRPVQFESANTGPNSTVPSTPAIGATTGNIVWSIGTLPNGTANQVTFTVRVPTGYVENKGVRARAVLTHDAGTTVSATSNNPVNVLADEAWDMRATSQAATQPAGATNVWVRIGFRNLKATQVDTMDAEDISFQVEAGQGSCIPTFRSASVVTAINSKYTHQLGALPPVGTPLDAANPVPAHFDRLPYDSNEAGKYLLVSFNVPATCVNGEFMRFTGTGTMYGGATVLPPVTLDVPIGDQLCRGTQTRAHRTQSGNPVMDDYLPWPTLTNQDTYVAGGSARPGEFLALRTPLGIQPTPTQTMDASYFHYIIPDGLSFHGVRLLEPSTGIHEVYKDCDGDALPPNDPAFTHTDPALSGWNTVSTAWSGPFTNAPNDADPTAIAGPSCELLFIKRNDGGGNNLWRVLSSFQVCDGTVCPVKSNLSTAILADAGYSYTVADVNNPVVNSCSVPNPGGHSFHVATQSYPLVDATPVVAVVLAGDIAELDVRPGNANRGSEFVRGQWYVDLYPHRDFVNLDGVLGRVLLTDGVTTFEYPGPDQNVTGASCDPAADITYHPPDASNCNAPGDAGCLAWFEVPDACQPANGYFGSSVQARENEHLPYLKFRLSLPVNTDVPPNTFLDLEAQVRQSDGITLGADNAAPTTRWPASNYRNIGSIEVLPSADAQVDKTGPAAWPDGGTMYYTLAAVNQGNVSLRGIYVIDELPRTGVNGSDFTPIYRRVYSDIPATDVVVESSVDPNCFSSDQGVAWTPVGNMVTDMSRPGYVSSTDTDIPATALCIRVHLANGRALAPGDVMLTAVGVEIPAGTMQGLQLGNRALVAATTNLNGAQVDLTEPGLSEILTTRVDPAPVVRVDKTFEVDPTRAGYIKWILRYYNASGAPVTGAVVIDTLPAQTTYDGLASPFDPGERCTDPDGMGDCLTINGGTQVSFTIDNTLTPFDGAQGTGTDEGIIEIWTVNNAGIPPDTVIQNCANATPTTTPPLADGCAETRTIDFTMGKTITGNPTTVNIGDTMEYVITSTNNTPDLYHVTIYDALPGDVSYVPGTLIINGSQASDNLISGQILDYQTPVDPGETLEIRLTVQINGPMGGGTISNLANGMGCTNPIIPTTCAPAIASTQVNVIVDSGGICGDGTVDAGEDCDDMGESATCDADCTIALCGDGTINMTAGETCDDSGESATCDADCSAAFCGDGTTNTTAGEDCDDSGESATCDADCSTATCGDGTINMTSGEECDDMGESATCDADCSLAFCGDGTVNMPAGEDCDDAGESATCDDDCTPAMCGDGTTNTSAGEDCDDAGESATCDVDCSAAICGDGVLNMSAGEECDDGNNTDGDGCQSTCLLPVCGDGVQDPGEACDDGNNVPGDGCRADCTEEICGDGTQDPGEQCDDGNNTDGDGCQANCTLPGCGDGIVDPGEQCDDMGESPTCDLDCTFAMCGDGNTNTSAGEECDDAGQTMTCDADCTTPVCGDGVLNMQAGEACDDGNNTDGDGCQGNCALPVCGDGIVDPGEQCDDGNNTDGDGCQADCSLPSCGDGVLDAGEYCDDGNMVPDDACSNTCQLGEGEPCTMGDASCDSGVCDTTGNPAPGVCEPANTCGNGVVEGGEECDDGGNVDDDGCSAACVVEEVCGDGILDAFEGCDDNNTMNGDGCNMDCLIEDGLPCNDNTDGMTGNDSCSSNICDQTGGAPGVCEPANTCGNSVMEGGEDCDDGNTDDGDGCSSTCEIEPGPVCGDGVMDAGEECDDGNTDDGDGCSSTCTIEPGPVCGDGVMEGDEQCDDGNTEGGDGCSAACELETEPVCGNGVLEMGEQCDDGNTDDGDGCSATCSSEGLGVSGGGCSSTDGSSGSTGILVFLVLLGGFFWRRRREVVA